jgi:cytidylate kinase
MRTPHPRSLDDLVNAQVLRWQARERVQPTRRAAPSIALSRLPGSGAAELGLRVADALGFGFFGIEIVDQIARARGVRRELVADLDERTREGIERWVSLTTRREEFRESDYLRELLRTLAVLSERGQVVVLGRGSPHVMPAERTLRVLVVAPRSARLERLAKARHLTAAEAETQLAREEAERLAFLRRDFAVEADDASHYDAAVNTETLGIDGAAELVLAAFRKRFPAGAGARVTG